MFITCTSESGRKCQVHLRVPTAERLQGTCLRGKGRPLAGNCSLWDRPYELLRALGPHLVAHVDEEWESTRGGTHRHTITFPHAVGWSSTEDLDRFDADDLVPFKLSEHARGLRLPDHAAVQAPLTSELTVVYKLKKKRLPQVVIHTVYPGPDVGPLQGDVSRRMLVAFFDWDHTGEQL